jgi:hypothetical protein
MAATVVNRRSGRERRQGERRQSPVDPTKIPDGLDRRSGTDRRQAPRRKADQNGAVPEHMDYQWRNRWP